VPVPPVPPLEHASSANATAAQPKRANDNCLRIEITSASS
jgi:hypothetical protein